MAGEVSNVPVNGTYAPHQGYAGMDQSHSYNSFASNATTAPPTTTPQAPPTSSTPAATTASPQPDVPKDEVGWYFVEQYYTTLSRSPEKLYLFYNKRSQFVSGQETDKVAVCVGQRAINDRIKELDFHDCKVRVTNVDSQSSDSNIVIQVIGEISNRSQPHKKFTQTFVLATQTNGYFVLNDIFRYLIEEEDEQISEVQTTEAPQEIPAEETGLQEPLPTVTKSESKTLTSSSDPIAIENDAKQVDKELEEKLLQASPKIEEPAPAAVNGVAEPEQHVHAEDAPVAAPGPSTEVIDAQPVTEEAEAMPEKPEDPEPIPAVSPPKQAPPEPVQAAQPPKTWASLAASANKVATPAAPPSAPPSSASQVKPAAQPVVKTPATASPSVSAPTAPSAQREASPAAPSDQDEWTAVGGSHHRQQSRQTNIHLPDTPQHRGYVKNVYEVVDLDELKAALGKHGEVTYLDISRQKNCAFVEFKTADDYNAVVSANPHTVNGEQLYVEERRMRPPGSGSWAPRGQFQGNRGRGGNQGGGPRGNYQGGGNGGGRGGYMSRGAGRGGPPGAGARGRGGAQAT